MTSKPTDPSAATLRRHAEDRLADRMSVRGAGAVADSKSVLHELEVHQIELEMQNEAIRLAQDRLAELVNRYTNLYDHAPVCYFTLDRRGAITQANLTGARLLGIQRGRIVGMRLGAFIAVADLPVFNGFLEQVFAGQPQPRCEVALTLGNQPVIVQVTATLSPGSQECLGVVVDVTERKRMEDYREMSLLILAMLIEPGDLRDSMRRVVTLIKERSGADAVGLRLLDGEDFPYFAQDGFSKAFLLTENTLLERDAAGASCRDCIGNACLACTCGLVIAGKTDPSSPFCTTGGSFWTNHAASLLEIPPAQDARYHPRNLCIRHGYASIALVPVRTKDRIIGLLQLNDHRQGCFSLMVIQKLEIIAVHIGEALMRKQAEKNLRLLSRRLLKAEDAERRRIAKELHDSTAQDMVAVMMSLDTLRENLAKRWKNGARLLEDGIAVLEKCTNDLRTLSYLLHPPRLDETGLIGAIRHFAEGFGDRTGIHVTLDLPVDLPGLSDDARLILFRVTQESLGNIHRHAHSPTAEIRIVRDAAAIVVEIRDTGCGFPASSVLSGNEASTHMGVGIPSMRERLLEIGGRLEIDSSPCGTTVRAMLPNMTCEQENT